MFYKRRDYSVVVNGRNPIVAHEYMGESVEGKDVLIADDISATGESMLDLARELKRRKCGRIFVATTFAHVHQRHRGVQPGLSRKASFDYILATNLNYLRPELLPAALVHRGGHEQVHRAHHRHPEPRPLASPRCSTRCSASRTCWPVTAPRRSKAIRSNLP